MPGVGRPLKPRPIWLIPLAIWVVALIAFVRGNDDGHATKASIRLAGAQQTVFSWDRDACEAIDVPDTPARAFRNASGDVILVASHFVTRLYAGSTLDTVRHRCQVSMQSQFDSNPARFDDRDWLSSVYTLDGTTVYGLLHDEYQGNTHPGHCRSRVYSRCWYNAITFAASRDGGLTFTRPQPPTHLVASVPYPYKPDFGRPYGVFQPSNILKKGNYYYVLVKVEQFGLQQAGACLMRTNRLEDPRSWRAWDGREFSVAFVDPYTAPPGTNPAQHVCAPVAPAEIEKMSQSLTYNTYLGKYLLVGAAGGYVPSRAENLWGIYFSVSDNLIDWTPRKLIAEAELPWTYKCGDRFPILYPSVLDPSSRSRNFETSGQRPWLYFTRFKYPGCQQAQGRDLVRVPLEITK